MAEIRLSAEQRRALGRLKPVADELGLYLAGGTAIAIHLNHRTSRDLDLFSVAPDFDLEVARLRIVALPQSEVVSLTDATLRMKIGKVPLDIVRYPYALLNNPTRGPEDFPVAGLEDLAAMKLSAAARRGIRRDFWDLYEIFQGEELSLEHALSSYVRRFGVSDSDLYHVLRALTYFEDAEADPLMPEGMSEEMWTTFKTWFLTHVPEHLCGLVSSASHR